jgi:hypothetical protein
LKKKRGRPRKEVKEVQEVVEKKKRGVKQIYTTPEELKAHQKIIFY